MSKTADDILDLSLAVAAAVDKLEADITELKKLVVDPADQAKFDEAIAKFRAAVADAGDGVDEAAPPAP